MSGELRGFDGVASRTIFCMWTGTNPLPPPRMAGLLAMLEATRCPMLLLTPRNIPDWELPEAPFHPALPLLSETHRADYLRAYLMHHYGGGYSDIKLTLKRWDEAFSRLQADPGALVLGYPEVGEAGVVAIDGPEGQTLRASWRSLIGCGAFICKRQTPFTAAWLGRVHALLDESLEQLRAHPARDPRDVPGLKLADGTSSRYPIAWSGILGRVFQPLVYAHREAVLQADITPIFVGYR